ncbi:hypothetical protein ACFYYR_15155 [Streptomyces sp. NPDC001922]|uniref:hypothetical protein n=1 Tax=Streptomyces sp. NPDC001922 TaxID=3364624 RepID=UPI0036906B6E
MAMRKATMKEQVSAAISQAAPGDRALVTVASLTGPTPWLTGALGLIGQLLVKYYFITLTDQAVVFHRMHRFSQRPKEVAYAIPRAEAPMLISEVALNPLWSCFHLMLPGEPKPTRLNVHRLWRAELEQFLSAVGGPQGAPQQGYPQQAMPPQGYPQQGMPPQAMPPQGAPQYGYPQSPQQQHGQPVPQQPGPYGQPAQAPPPPAPYGQQGPPVPQEPWGVPEEYRTHTPQQQPAPHGQQGPPVPQEPWGVPEEYRTHTPQQQQPGPYGAPGAQPGPYGAPQQPGPYGAPQQGNPYGG